MDVGSIIASELIKTIVPKGIDYFWNYIAGKKILILGIGRSGKSRFQQFLWKGTLVKEMESDKTRVFKRSSNVILKLGTRSEYKLRIRTTIDTPGQYGPIEQASSVSSFTPDIVFVFLDCSRIKESTEWFTNFCENLDSEFHYRSSLAGKIKNIYVILNKYDKLGGDNKEQKQETYGIFHKEIREIMFDILKYSFFRYRNRKRVPKIFPAVCVKTEFGTSFLDELVSTFAEYF